MALGALIMRAATEAPAGVTGFPGQAIAEDAARKIVAADSVYAPLLILALVGLFLLGYLLWRAGQKREGTLENLTTVTVQAKDTTQASTKAITEFGAASNAVAQALRDLARESEGEHRETRHSLVQHMTVAASTHDLVRRIESKIEENGRRLEDNGRRMEVIERGIASIATGLDRIAGRGGAS